MKLDKLVEKCLKDIDGIIKGVRTLSEYDDFFTREIINPYLKEIDTLYQKLQKSIQSLDINIEDCITTYEYLVLSQCLGSLVKKDTSKIKEKLSECLSLMKKSESFNQSVESYYERYKSENIWEGNAVKEVSEFYSFFKNGNCEDKYYSFALYWLNFFINNDDSLFITNNIYMSIVSFAARFNQGRENIEYEISGFIISYFDEYCRQTSYEKRHFYTDEDSINFNIQIQEQTERDWHQIKFRGRDIVTTYNWITLYVLFECDTPDRSNILHQLFEKVFLNKNVVFAIDGKYKEKIYERPSDIIHKFINEINISLKPLPGVVIMLYMLCKELSESEFYQVFPLLESKELREIKGQDWIDLSELNYFPPFLSNIIKNTGESIKKAIFNKERNDYCNFLLNGLFFFCMWENCSYTVCYDKSREALLDEFYSATVKKSWYKQEKITSLLNSAARYYNFEKVDVFNSYNVQLNISNINHLNLFYNLSRTEVGSESSLKKQITILRDIQLNKLPLDCYRNKDDKNSLKTLKSNQKKLRELDFGFKIPHLRTCIYPFSGEDFVIQYGANYYLIREYLCKFICETDTQYIFDNGVHTDFRATNKLGLSTRYLFKDRNMSIHDSKHVSVQNLLNNRFVDNLLYFLGDSYILLNSLLSKEKELTQTDCVITFLLNKAKKLYKSVIEKINEALRERISNELSDDIKSYEETVISVTEEKKNITLIYDDKLLKKLEIYLNYMFAVNEKNEYGDSDNYLYIDFFRQYHSEIALYTTYLTFALDKA